MLARIAAFTESHRPRTWLAVQRELLKREEAITGRDRMTSVVEHALATVPCDIVLMPDPRRHDRAHHLPLQTTGLADRTEL